MELEIEEGYIISKPTPSASDVLPPSRLPYRNLPNSTTKWGSSVQIPEPARVYSDSHHHSTQPAEHLNGLAAHGLYSQLFSLGSAGLSVAASLCPGQQGEKDPDTRAPDWIRNEFKIQNVFVAEYLPVCITVELENPKQSHCKSEITHRYNWVPADFSVLRQYSRPSLQLTTCDVPQWPHSLQVRYHPPALFPLPLGGVLRNGVPIPRGFISPLF